MKIINLSPNDITLLSPNTPTSELFLKGRYVKVFSDDIKYLNDYILKVFKGYDKELPKIMEVPTDKTLIRSNDDILVPVQNESNIIIKNLPKERKDVLYIGSNRLCRAMKKLGRNDIVYPNNLVARLNDNKTFTTIGTLSFERL